MSRKLKIAIMGSSGQLAKQLFRCLQELKQTASMHTDLSSNAAIFSGFATSSDVNASLKQQLLDAQNSSFVSAECHGEYNFDCNDVHNDTYDDTHNDAWKLHTLHFDERLQAYADADVFQFSHDECDITNKAQLEACLYNGQSFDIIFNCAAMTNVDACESNEQYAFDVNAQGVCNLARIAQKTGAKLVYISTDYVFEGNAHVPYKEDDICNPQTVYGKSKLEGERLIQSLMDCFFVVRTAWLYGTDGSNFPKTIMRLARENGSIKVVNDQYGSPTYVKDLASALLLLALTEDYGIYHCTNRGACSWFDFACAVVDKAHISCTKHACSSQEFVRPAKRPAYSVLNSSKLEHTIGIEMRTWQDALSDFMYVQNE